MQELNELKGIFYSNEIFSLLRINEIVQHPREEKYVNKIDAFCKNLTAC
jgi:hypothetical protein